MNIHKYANRIYVYHKQIYVYVRYINIYIYMYNEIKMIYRFANTCEKMLYQADFPSKSYFNAPITQSRVQRHLNVSKYALNGCQQLRSAFPTQKIMAFGGNLEIYIYTYIYIYINNLQIHSTIAKKLLGEAADTKP